ncbi:MAG: alanine racemase [Rhodovibrionaceae bacterium]
MPSASGGGASLLTIDLEALAWNYRLLRERVGSAGCGAAVMAHAYDIGMTAAAPKLWGAGCRDFFVATLEEGALLRALLPEAAISVFNGLLPGEEADFAAQNLVPVLNDPGQIERWATYCKERGARPAAIHFDTGMARLGLMPSDTDALLADPEILSAFGKLQVMSHLACADTPDSAMNEAQRAAFARIASALPRATASLANSYGVFLDPAYHFDLARPGIALYGGNPAPAGINPMRQVVRLQGRILQVRQIDAPQSVGYGATFRAEGPLRLATVAAGYADGYLRYLSNRGHAWVGDKRVAVVGRVSMDLISLDVTGLPENAAQPGGLVDLLSPREGVDGLAAEAGTIPYEILTALGARYRRSYLGR